MRYQGTNISRRQSIRNMDPGPFKHSERPIAPRAALFRQASKANAVCAIREIIEGSMVLIRTTADTPAAVGSVARTSEAFWTQSLTTNVSESLDHRYSIPHKSARTMDKTQADSRISLRSRCGCVKQKAVKSRELRLCSRKPVFWTSLFMKLYAFSNAVDSSRYL